MHVHVHNLQALGAAKVLAGSRTCTDPRYLSSSLELALAVMQSLLFVAVPGGSGGGRLGPAQVLVPGF